MTLISCGAVSPAIFSVVNKTQTAGETPALQKPFPASAKCFSHWNIFCTHHLF